jgi:hypothetical protein
LIYNVGAVPGRVSYDDIDGSGVVVRTTTPAIHLKQAPAKGWPGFADFILLPKQ